MTLPQDLLDVQRCPEVEFVAQLAEVCKELTLDRSATVLELLRARPLSSRSDLAAGSRLSEATISRVLSRLRNDGFVEEVTSDPAGYGRPPGLARIRRGAAHVIGIDAGGRHLRGIAVDLTGEIEAADAVQLAETAAPDVIAAILDLARRLSAGVPGSRCLAAAIGASGMVRPETGRVVLSPDLPALVDVSLAADLEGGLGVAVAVDNDDLLSAVGEAAFGVAAGCRDVVFLSLGFGLGAGVIVGGRPLRGSDGSAGAIAYLAPGRLEERASGRAIAARYRLAMGDASTDLEAATVFARARAGDTVAGGVVSDAIEALADAVVNVAALLDPEVIVLGGGLMNNRAVILGPVSARLAAAVPYPPRLVVSSLGDEAVTRGAGLLGLTIADRLLATRFGRQPGLPEPARIGTLELV